MEDLKSKHQIIIERLMAEGRVTLIDNEKKDAIIKAVEKGLEEYRFQEQKRSRDSQKEIANVVLTA